MFYKLTIKFVLCLIFIFSIAANSYAENETPSPIPVVSPSIPASSMPSPSPADSQVTGGVSPTDSPSASPDGPSKVQYKADNVDYEKGPNWASLSGNVEIKYQNIVLTSEKIEMDTKNKIVYSKTPFKLIQKDSSGKEQIVTGKTLEYDLVIKRGEVTEGFLEIPAQTEGQTVYIYGETLTSYDNGNRIVVNNGNFTTCNHRQKGEMTHYTMAAEIIDYIPNSRVFAWNVGVYFMEQRIFWFPFFAIPLEQQEYNLDMGRNEVEGLYFRTKNYYYINESHDGWIFNNFMEKKGWATGFEHVWLNMPNSISRFYFYGIPYSFNFYPPKIDFTNQPFADREIMIEHKQLLLPNMEAEFTLNDKNFYTISSYQAPRDIFTDLNLKLTDKEIFSLNENTELETGLNFTGNYRKGTNENKTVDLISRSISENINLTGALNLSLGSGNATLNTTWQNNTTWSEQEILNSATATTTPTALPSPNTTKNLTNSLQYSQEIIPSLNFSSNINHRRSELGGTDPTQEPDHQIDTSFNLTQDLKWGKVALAVNKRIDLSSKASEEATIKQRNYIDKLPEITFTTNQALFQEFFPITPNLKLGRIFASSNYSQDNPFNDISRFMMDLNFGANWDFGMGMKVNYSGSSFSQRFYQTTDAEYAFRGQLNVSNDIIPYFIPSVTYQRQITDKENNNPLPIDGLGESKSHTLNYDLRMGNIPECTWLFNGGYDYEGKRYSSFITSLSSQIEDNFALTAQWGYNPRNISKTDLDQTNPQNPKLLTDLDGKEIPDLYVTESDIGRLELRGGKWSSLVLGAKWRPTDEDFGGQFGLDDNIKQGVEFGVALGYDFNKWQFENFYTQLTASVGTDWIWHTELLLESSFDLNKQKDGFLEAFNPFNKFVLKKDLHDFILIVSYDRFYQQFGITLSMLAFPFSTNDISSVTSRGFGL